MRGSGWLRTQKGKGIKLVLDREPKILASITVNVPINDNNVLCIICNSHKIKQKFTLFFDHT